MTEKPTLTNEQLMSHNIVRALDALEQSAKPCSGLVRTSTKLASMALGRLSSLPSIKSLKHKGQQI